MLTLRIFIKFAGCALVAEEILHRLTQSRDASSSTLRFLLVTCEARMLLVACYRGSARILSEEKTIPSESSIHYFMCIL
ncbi:hypothetical protein APB14_20380 [Pseudomonas aeruginosa]|nr:hypothetical protein APB14_20380 [Pseudomonas aeruginosa]RIZ10792.1 hypothetical protein AXW96_15640 [Pseudomonas aeruginosa]